MLHYVGLVAKRLRAAEPAAAHQGDNNTPSGPTGRGVKMTIVARSGLKMKPCSK